MKMANPMHPGEVIRTACLEPLDLSVTKAASILDVSRQTLDKLLNKRGGVSPEMAIRLEKAFGSTAEAWLRMQMNYDLAKARRMEDQIKVTRYTGEAA